MPFVEASESTKPFIALWSADGGTQSGELALRVLPAARCNTRRCHNTPWSRVRLSRDFSRFNTLSKLEYGDREPVAGGVVPLFPIRRSLFDCPRFYWGFRLPSRRDPSGNEIHMDWSARSPASHGEGEVYHSNPGRGRAQGCGWENSGYRPPRKADNFLLPSRIEDLHKESFSNFKVEIWPEARHLPFFEQPKKRDAMLSSVKGVNETRS